MAHEESLGDVAAICDALRKRHGCHTVILYGSRANGDARPNSDIDVAGFSAVASVKRIAGKWRSSYVDAFVYPEIRLDEPNAELLSLRGGLVLYERDGAGRRLLHQLEEIHSKGPEPLTEEERITRRQWAWKMLERAEAEDPEGNFRRAWLLTDLLEDYFALRNLWYLGPKKSLAYLSRESPETYVAFAAALQPGASLAAVRNAVIIAVGEPARPLKDDLAP